MVDWIKEAIARDIAPTRPRSDSREEYKRTVGERLDGLFAGAEDRPNESLEMPPGDGGRRPA